MNPGAPEAVNAGCTCNPLENNHGIGRSIGGKIRYWPAESCPLHSESEIVESIETA